MMYHLHHFEDSIGWLRLFESITFRAALACLTAFLGSIWLGPFAIRALVALKAGQPIRSAAVIHKLAELHQGKAGTPTMGGLLIIAMVLAATLLWARIELPFVHTCAFVLVAAGAVGFADDLLKVRRRKSDGLSARGKLWLLALVALLAGGYLAWHPATGEFIRQFHVPFFKKPVVQDLGWLSLPFFVIVMVSAANAVNLTDGLDGLAAGCAATTVSTYGFMAYAAGTVTVADYLLLPHHPQLGELSVFSAGLLGACLGFLWFNCHPAQIFMGDTGSLGIGGALAALALCGRNELLLVLVGGVFVMEALSVIIQVGSFKLRGKRVFRMAPLHHHFELKGWHENQVILRFWMISALFALLGLATLKVR
jgi:phospho-N-acetylmuramoyl-pentapeptide-transferase